MANNFPKEVGLNKADYDKLRQFYAKAYQSISEELSSATDFGYANRASLLRQIQGVLQQYTDDVTAFLQTEIPGQYEKGAQLAVDQLNELGVEADLVATMSQVDQAAVESMLTSAQHSLGAAVQGVTKNMSQLLSAAQKQTIKEILANGILSGEARDAIRTKIVTQFQDQGIGSLTDAGGKTWQLDSYADMLTRTTACQARNEGITNTLLDNNQDLVQVSNSGSTHPVCEDWEDAILSISGDSDLDIVDGSLDDAESDGLFHPNCEHTVSAYVPDLSDQTIQYDAETGAYTDQAAGE